MARKKRSKFKKKGRFMSRTTPMKQRVGRRK